MRNMHMFAGGNTSRGFHSCFEDILPAKERRRMFYIKGGPGVGKSTMMRRIAEAAEKLGQRVEYFHCSSDPDSLDGIALPELGWAMMDGTAPHVYDPVIPGARDTLVSLGDFLDEGAMRPKAREINGLQQEISLRFHRCYGFLSAAGELGRLCASGQLREDALHRLACDWTAELPKRGGLGSCRRLFASAFTPKGLVDVLPRDGLSITRVECPACTTLTPLWQEISWTACWRGLPVVHLVNPLWPDQLDGILLPEQGILLCSCLPGSCPDAVEWGRIALDEKSSEQEQSYDRNAYQLMLQRGVEQLGLAKKLHDELESHYVGHMDFLAWQGKLDSLLGGLEAAVMG